MFSASSPHVPSSLWLRLHTMVAAVWVPCWESEHPPSWPPASAAPRCPPCLPCSASRKRHQPRSTLPGLQRPPVGFSLWCLLEIRGWERGRSRRAFCAACWPGHVSWWWPPTDPCQAGAQSPSSSRPHPLPPPAPGLDWWVPCAPASPVGPLALPWSTDTLFIKGF